jgi:ABC-2 type transport system ATP-binding protein
MIEVENLTKVYASSRGRRTAVNNVSFSVPRGEFFALLGPNGAGKTTTISILATILSPTSGKVRIDGVDVQKNPHLVRQKIGVIFQDPSLDDRLSAVENMDFHGRLYGMPPEERIRRSEFLLNMVELWDRRGDLVRTFSGGMRRRLEIARGLMHFPQLLILDEPTIGLDPKTRRSLWDYIHRARREWAMTILLTTHYLEEADGADRVAIMDQGTFAALDTPAALKKSIGPEVIILETPVECLDSLRAYLQERYGPSLEIRDEGEGRISFPLPAHENSSVQLIRDLPGTIQSVTIRTPHLDDVFIQLTGRGMVTPEEGTEPFHRVYRGKL